MSQKILLRFAAITAATMFVGCQAGMKSAPPTAAVKTETVKPQVAASEPAKASVQQPPPPAEVSPTNKTANSEPSTPKAHTAFYRADSKPATIPRVLLSKSEEAMCKVKVGDMMPVISLPKLPGSGSTKLADLFGKKATVVVFWKSDRRMSQQQLADLRFDVVDSFGKQGVAVVGIAVDNSAPDAWGTFKKSGATFPNLLDADGKAFALVGNGRFPRTYLLDPAGKILWFDIEYSLATRRELHQALRAIAGDK